MNMAGIEIEDIDDVKTLLESILDYLGKEGILSKEDYASNLAALHNGGDIVIRIQEPRRNVCPMCGTVHGHYKSLDEAFDVLYDPRSLPECKIAVEKWMKERMKMEEKHE